MNSLTEILKSFLEKMVCKHDWELYSRMNTHENGVECLPIKIMDTLVYKRCGKFKKLRL
jgi:hypothetical protein